MKRREFIKLQPGDRVLCGGNWREVTGIDLKKGTVSYNVPAEIFYKQAKLKPKETREKCLFKQMHGLTTLQIAEATGKSHTAVLMDVYALMGQGVQGFDHEMSKCDQERPKGFPKNMDLYSLTLKGCLILASGYEARLREKVISKLEEANADGLPEETDDNQ